MALQRCRDLLRGDILNKTCILEVIFLNAKWNLWLFSGQFVVMSSKCHRSQETKENLTMTSELKEVVWIQTTHVQHVKQIYHCYLGCHTVRLLSVLIKALYDRPSHCVI